MDGVIAQPRNRFHEAAPVRQTPGSPPRLTRLKSRYTRFVGAMKLALPLTACALAALVIVWPQFEDQRRGFRLAASPVVVDDVRGQRVVNARYSGTDSKDQPFVVTADEALQANDDPENVQLRNAQADLSLHGGAWLALTAPAGRFRKDGNILRMFGGIILFRDDGYEMKTESATIDLKEGTARGSRPVTGQGPFGTLAARGFELLEAGQRIMLIGRSQLILNTTKEPAK